MSGEHISQYPIT
ncbi:hypothetical protein YPPY55_1833, partial [Yersinia pestis PY-55]